MRKATLIALLCMAALVVGSKDFGSGSQYREENSNNERAKPFRSGHEYTFTYNTQVATGMVAPETSEEPGMPQQKAVTRMQAQARIQFSSERHATLQLSQIRLGQLNEQIPEPDRVKPMSMFQQKQIPEEKYGQLQLPAQFIYADGVIERIQFHGQDETWSKNIKRAVLNMIQMNLKKNNAQGLRLSEELNRNNNYAQLDENEEKRQEGEPQAFSLPEITIEGDCQAMYSVQQQDRRKEQFNVTKSINFKQCRKIADVAYGYQTQQPQPQCSQCQQQWYKQLQQQRQQGTDADEAEPWQQQNSPCERECDPKEVKEQKLSRSTVQRCVLQGNQDKYGIKRCEMTSQYVYKNLNAETGQYGSAMHSIVSSELVFRRSEQKNQPSGHQQRQSSDKDESLLFSNQQDVDEKRYYMNGDEEYGRDSPFKNVQGKVQKAEQALRKLVQTAANKQEGIEIQIEAPIQLQRLVETMRMCTLEELKEIERSAENDNNNHQGQPEREMAKQFFTDALAIAGTRNTIQRLVEKINNNKLSPAKASQALRALQGLPAPSDSQVRMVERLCKSDVSQRSEQLKQACWLTFGSMVNELCQHKTQRSAQQSILGAQSGFDDEVCPLDKKQNYRQTLVELFQNAQTTYNKVLALKALGNAGIDVALPDLEKIIENQQEDRIARMVAIDALRRLRTQKARKIQNILVPLFLNNQEQPELRMAAFTQVMNTLPEQQVIDQIAYSLTKERSQHVLAFVYNTMKSISNTKNPVAKPMAKHIKNALKLVNVDDQALKMNGRAQIPIFSQDQNEGVFVNLYSAFTSQSALPSHVSAQLNSMLNGDYQTSDLSVNICQQDIDKWYEQLRNAFQQQRFGSSNSNRAQTRGQRREQQSSRTLRDIYTALGIKSRRSSLYQQQNPQQNDQEEPFAMLNLRIADVDQAIISVGGDSNNNNYNQFLRSILKGDRPSLAQIFAAAARNLNNNNNNQQHYRMAMATNFNEKRASIPTSAGLPLWAQQSVPVIATAEAQLNSECQSLGSSCAKVQTQIALNAAHIQKLECAFGFNFVTGAKSIRSLELNAPINTEVAATASHGVQIKVKIPQNKNVQVLGLHSLPTTFTADYDQNKKTLRDPKIKAVHNPQIEQAQRDVNTVVGRAMGLPFHIKGHYYRPSNPTNYKQLVQMLMASENQIHVEFQPNQQTPHEVVLSIQGSHFERIQGQNPQFENFYSRENQFYADSREDFQEMDNHNARRQKLNMFLGQYKSGQMYKHALKISAHCVGGQSNCKGQMEIQTACDAKFKYCNAKMNMERTPLNNNEDNNWTLKAQAEILRPESVSNVNQLQELSQRNQKFIAQANWEWGSNNKQHLNVRIQGEQAMKRPWRQIEEAESRQNKNFKRQTTFLNKFDVSADYKLQPFAQNAFNRVFEALKATNFWNTQSVPLNENTRQQGHVQATVVIDPITQKHANVTVRTPQQAVRIEAMELPIPFRPFPLIRSSEKSTHSALQLFNRWAVSGRAECTVDGRGVNSFDGVQYRSPISKCYTVLAKDCSGDDPQFVVMMKAFDNNNNPQGQNQKKIKVITPEQSVECQPKNQDSAKLVCKVNGQTVNDHNNDAEDQTVEFNNDQKTDCTINVEGVSVRFNGRKAWIKISSQYKNGQCGLCGHYDGEWSSEWRMNNNEETENLAQFHRSYSLQQDDECTANEHQDFYNQLNKKMYRRSSTGLSSSSSESSEESSSEEEKEFQYQRQQQQWEEDDNQSFEGDDSWFNSGRWQNRRMNNYNFNSNYYNNKNNDQNCRSPNCRSGSQQPQEQTYVMEMGSSKICFSMHSVRQCPRGTYPADKEQKQKNVKFTCLNRSSEKARQLLREARRGEVLDMREYQPSLTESVQEPTKCKRY